MTKRTLLAVAAGVLAGATVVGVPAFALADAPSDPGTAGSHMGSMMDDPEFFDRMGVFMSEMMSDEQMREQMRDMMKSMPDMGSMGGMHGGGADHTHSDSSQG
jgi:hypothetical protein